MEKDLLLQQKQNEQIKLEKLKAKLILPKKKKTVVKRYKVERDGSKTPVAVTPLSGFKVEVLSKSLEVTPTGKRKIIITRSLSRSSNKEVVKVKKELKIA